MGLGRHFEEAELWYSRMDLQLLCGKLDEWRNLRFRDDNGQ